MKQESCQNSRAQLHFDLTSREVKTTLSIHAIAPISPPQALSEIEMQGYNLLGLF